MTPVQLNLLELCKEKTIDLVFDFPNTPVEILCELVEYDDELITDLYYKWCLEKKFLFNSDNACLPSYVV